METIEPALRKHPFFEGLDRAYMELVTRCASNVRFEAGQFVFRQHEDANTFYVIRQGKVALELSPPGRPPITLQTVNKEEILGWAWLVPPYHWPYDAHAVELTRAIALDGKCLRNKCVEDHNLGYELLNRLLPVIGKRMEATQLQLLDVYGTKK